MFRVFFAPLAKLTHNQAVGSQFFIFSGMIIRPMTIRTFHHYQVVL
jgi:hypothetical protein